jgi:hypothetical protein
VGQRRRRRLRVAGGEEPLCTSVLATNIENLGPNNLKELPTSPNIVHLPLVGLKSEGVE